MVFVLSRFVLGGFGVAGGCGLLPSVSAASWRLSGLSSLGARLRALGAECLGVELLGVGGGGRRVVLWREEDELGCVLSGLGGFLASRGPWVSCGLLWGEGLSGGCLWWSPSRRFLLSPFGRGGWSRRAAFPCGSRWVWVLCDLVAEVW